MRPASAPSGNQLLAALPRAEYERLLPWLEAVSLPEGWTMYRAGDRVTHAYFVTAGIVSRLGGVEGGETAESAVTGNEGVIGIASFLRSDTASSHAVVLSAGYGYRLAADLLASEFERDGALRSLLLRYTLALAAQTGQVAACNRLHSLEQRLCRWILSCLDRLPSNELATTHGQVAEVLGVRRESVSDVAAKLQAAGLVRCRRGRIAVLDRRGLEARTCECRAGIRQEYDRLLRTEVAARDAGERSMRARQGSVREEPACAELT
jgi:CRP-like cAMP-binding protein